MYMTSTVNLYLRDITAKIVCPRGAIMLASCMPSELDGQKTQLYRALCSAFLEKGPRFLDISQQFDIPLSALRQVWEKGIPSLDLPPISRIYQEQQQDRALTQSANSCAASSNGLDAAFLRALPPGGNVAYDVTPEESAMLSGFRTNISSALELSSTILNVLRRVAVTTADRLAAEMEASPHLTLEALLARFEAVSRATDGLSRATMKVVQMQRLLMGAPQQITENRAPDDSQEKLRTLMRVADMMRSAKLDGTTAPQQVIDAMPYEGEESSSTLPDDVTKAA